MNVELTSSNLDKLDHDPMCLEYGPKTPTEGLQDQLYVDSDMVADACKDLENDIERAKKASKLFFTHKKFGGRYVFATPERLRAAVLFYAHDKTSRTTSHEFVALGEGFAVLTECALLSRRFFRGDMVREGLSDEPCVSETQDSGIVMDYFLVDELENFSEGIAEIPFDSEDEHHFAVQIERINPEAMLAKIYFLLTIDKEPLNADYKKTPSSAACSSASASNAEPHKQKRYKSEHTREPLERKRYKSDYTHAQHLPVAKTDDNEIRLKSNRSIKRERERAKKHTQRRSQQRARQRDRQRDRHPDWQQERERDRQQEWERGAKDSPITRDNSRSGHYRSLAFEKRNKRVLVLVEGRKKY